VADAHGLITVHPRERGEHEYRKQYHPAWNGSSPRARGTLPRRAGVWTNIRFIPASAGNTRKPGLRRSHRAVHPRERGEHGDGVLDALQICGSSPRARGTPGSNAKAGDIGRFIPASAGNTASCFR